MSASRTAPRRVTAGLAVLAASVALALAPAAAGVLPSCGGAATKDWVGPAGGGSWQTPANWDGGAVPAAGEDVCVAGTGTVTFSGSAATIASLQTSGMGLTMSSGTLSVAAGADPSTIRGPLNLIGGTLDLDGGANLDGVSQSAGILDGAGQITLDGPGPFTWNGGTWQGTAPVLVAPGRTLTLGTNATKTLNRTLINHGTTTLTNIGSSLNLGSAAALTNGTTGNPGVLHLQGDLTIGSSGGASITNSTESTITKPTGTGTTTITPPLTNTGTLDIQTGTVTLNAAATNTGTIQLGANTLVLTGPGTHSLGGTIQATGTGTVRFQANANVTGSYQAPFTELLAGTVTFNAPRTLPAFTQTSGTLAGAGQITLDGPGPFTWNGGTWQGTAPVLVAPGRTLTLGTNATKTLNRTLVNHGTTTLNSIGSSLTLGNAATLTNGATGTPGLLQLQGDLTISASGGASITNSAESTITKPTGAGTTNIAAALTNTGTLDITTGTLSLNTAATNTGTIQMGASTLVLAGVGTHGLGGTLQSTGTVRFQANANVTGSYQASLTELLAGTVTFNAPQTLPAFTQTSGTLAGAGQITLDGPGPFTWNGGTWQGTAPVLVAPGRTLTLGTNATKNLNRTLVNHGTTTLNSIGSSLTLGNAATLTNGATGTPGLLQLQGDLTISAGSGASITNSTESTITKPTGTGTTNIAAALTNTGTLDITAGTLSLNTALSNFSGAALTGGTYRVAGVLRFPSANVATLAAHVVLDGPTAAVQDTAGVNGLRNLASISGTGTLIVQNGATATSTAPVANAGTVAIGSGSTLTTGGSVANSGTLEGSGQLVTGVSGTLTNTGTIRPGTGTGGIGTLSVSGGYQQSAAGVLEVDVSGADAGTTHDRLSVSGGVNLAGTLTIVTAPAYTPAVPTAHTVVTGSTVTGTFATVTGRVGVLGGRYTVEYAATSVTLRFAPPAITVTVPPTLDLGTLPIGTSGTGTVSANVDSTYRAGYLLSVARTAFPESIPLRMQLLTAPAGAELFGVAPGVPFAIPVSPAPGQTVGRRLGGPAPDESGLTPEGTGDTWQVTVTGGPVGWAPAGTHTTIVTFTAVTV